MAKKTIALSSDPQRVNPFAQREIGAGGTPAGSPYSV
jgi:hypothetical protein